MDWFTDLFTQHSAIQAVVVLSLISVFGMMLGKVRFFGISLGVTFVFFIGIAAGHFGLSVDPSMLAFAESFGLVLFVYALGLQVGPGFFSSLRSGGIRLVSLATLIVLTGSALAVGLGYDLRRPNEYPTPSKPTEWCRLAATRSSRAASDDRRESGFHRRRR